MASNGAASPGPCRTAGEDTGSAPAGTPTVPVAPKRWSTRTRLLVILVVPVLLSAVGGFVYRQPATQQFFMRFFRDLSRYKAHKRLHGNVYGLTVFAGMDDPLAKLELRDDGLRFTREELARFNGEDGRPLYLAIRKRVYDVSGGPSFYGRGRTYHKFVGRDATRAFGTACTSDDCLVSSEAGLAAPQLKEVDRWLDFYERHDKYRYIGMLVTDPVEDALQSTLLEEDMLHSALGDAAGGTPFDQAVRFHQQGARAYRKQDLEGALSFWASALMTLGPTGGLGEEATVELRANVMLGMGAVELKRGNGWQAEEHYEETLEGLREGFGQDVADSHPLYARALSDQATCFYMNKKLAEARRTFEESLSCYGRALARQAPGVLSDGDTTEGDDVSFLSAETAAGMLPLRANTQLNLAATITEAISSGNVADAATERALAQQHVSELLAFIDAQEDPSNTMVEVKRRAQSLARKLAGDAKDAEGNQGPDSSEA